MVVLESRCSGIDWTQPHARAEMKIWDIPFQLSGRSSGWNDLPGSWVLLGLSQRVVLAMICVERVASGNFSRAFSYE